MPVTVKGDRHGAVSKVGGEGLGVDAGTDFANFVGYILWSIWLLAFAILIWRRSDIGDPAAPQLAT
jgi:hypothetical protein